MVWSHPTSSQPAAQPLQPQPAIPAKRIKVMVGIPFETKLYAYWAVRMLAPLFYQTVPWADKCYQMAKGVPLPVARDMIVEAALEDPDVTHILWVDSDNVCVKPPNPNDALGMLLECDQPIVSGLYRAKQESGFNYAMWINQQTVVASDGGIRLDGDLGFQPVHHWDGNWLQVDAIGMGFCLARREVYEKLKKPWHPWPTKAPSEDFNWCIAAKKAGYQINVFTEVQLDHCGDLVVHPDGGITTMGV